MDKLLITGASGFLGSFLIKEALGRNVETYAGIRSTSSKNQLTDPNIQFCEIDFEDKAGLETLLMKHKFDYIIHNAGITRASSASEYFKVNADYTEHFGRLALKINPALKKFVFISSIESFGSADGTPNQLVEEGIDPNPRTIYGQSKQRAEQKLKAIEGLPFIILRPTAIFGPFEKDIFAVFKTINKFRFAPIVGSKKIKYTFVYVKDVARVTLDACLSEITQKAYFVGDGRIYSIEQFNRYIAESFQMKTFSVVIPYFLLDGVVHITSLLDKITGSTSLLNKEQVDKFRAQNWDCDISPLVRDFNFQPAYNLKAAIKETSDWYLANKWL